MKYSNESVERLAKIKALREAGVIPYANKFTRTHNIQQLIDASKTLSLSDSEKLMETGAKKQYSIAGRMLIFRAHGKLSFAKLVDGHNDIQLCFVKDKVTFNTGKQTVDSLEISGEVLSAYKLAEKYLNMGDFIGVHGELFITKHGELTLFVNEFQILSKAVRPLPEKFHGISDQETIYRQRYLDLISNEESFQRMMLRPTLIRLIREFYHKNGFVELETPVIGSAASGAAAKPFITHHNDFDEDFFLRISPETNLKKATVGRFERVFEIGKQFRNEGSDPSHLQEFTSIEHYAVYWNYEDNMKYTEELFDYIFQNLGLGKVLKVKDKEGNIKDVDFTTPWARIDYVEGVKEKCGIDVSQYLPGDEPKLREAIRKAGVEFEGMDIMATATLIDYLYKKVLRPQILGPAFVYNYPKTMQPLARANDENPGIVEQFQLVINAWEVIKAYTELVDPIIQKANFDEQADAQARGDEETTAGDDDFVLAMEYGMPPQSGWGMGIDRIFTLLTGQDNLRDAILFPLMKPEVGNDYNRSKADSSKQPTDGRDGLHQSKAEDRGQTAGNNKIQYDGLPTLEQGIALVDKYATDTKKHLMAVGYVMKHFAKKLGQNELAWQLAGMLHDIDWDYTGKNVHDHCTETFEKMADEINLPQSIRTDIKSHAHFITGVQPTTLLGKYLCALDELTGFVGAVARVQPNKTLEEVKPASVAKKIKDKSFAKGVDRTEVRNAETMLGLNMEEVIQEIIDALKPYAKELGM